MRIRLFVTTALVIATVRCVDEKEAPHGPSEASRPASAQAHGERADAHDEHAHDIEKHEGHEDHAVSGATVVRIDQGMLRDLRITTAPAERRSGGEGVVILGEARVNEEAYAEIGASIPARVRRLLVNAGDRVRAGQAVVELESIELGRARAAHTSASARESLARGAVERKRGLAVERIVSQREVQEAEAEHAGALAEQQAAAEVLAALGSELGRNESSAGKGSQFSLTSPLAGTVLSRDGAPGRMVDMTRPIVRVASLETLWVEVHAFERDALRVRQGAAARISFAALPGRTFDGTVRWIGSEVDVASRTMPVRLEVKNSDGALRPGMSASAWVPLGDGGDHVVTVPSLALQRLSSGWVVFLARGEGVFEARAVGRGRDLGGEVEIVSGLAAPESVVVEGAFLLKAEAEKARGGGDHHDH